MLSWKSILFAVTAGLIISSVSGMTLLAADPVPPKLALTVTQTDSNGVPVISMAARMSEGDKPLSSKKVEFYMVSELFGKQLALIDSEMTDGTGIALGTYKPTRQGTYNIIAKFNGDTAYTKIQVSQDLQITGAIAPYESGIEGLGTLGGLTLQAVGLVVVAIWGLLLLVLFRSVYGISQARD